MDNESYQPAKQCKISDGEATIYRKSTSKLNNNYQRAYLQRMEYMEKRGVAKNLSSEDDLTRALLGLWIFHDLLGGGV